MNVKITVAILTLASSAFAHEGHHPGLPPSSSSSAYSTDRTVYEDVYKQGRWVNTKYGTAMTPEEIEQATQNRRANREKVGGPEVGTPRTMDSDTTTY